MPPDPVQPLSRQSDKAMIQGLMIDEWAEVTKADDGLRNLYGGVVRLKLHWADGDSHAMISLDLDQQGAEDLATALLRYVRASSAEYEESQADG